MSEKTKRCNELARAMIDILESSDGLLGKRDKEFDVLHDEFKPLHFATSATRDDLLSRLLYLEKVTDAANRALSYFIEWNNSDEYKRTRRSPSALCELVSLMSGWHFSKEMAFNAVARLIAAGAIAVSPVHGQLHYTGEVRAISKKCYTDYEMVWVHDVTELLESPEGFLRKRERDEEAIIEDGFQLGFHQSNERLPKRVGDLFNERSAARAVLGMIEDQEKKGNSVNLFGLIRDVSSAEGVCEETVTIAIGRLFGLNEIAACQIRGNVVRVWHEQSDEEFERRFHWKSRNEYYNKEPIVRDSDKWSCFPYWCGSCG